MKKTAKNHQKPQTERDFENVAAAFDELIHSPNRLRICAALAAVAEIEFANLERSVGITTQLMSKQLKLLAHAGYIHMEKRPETIGRPRTWVSFTPAGRRAYSGHINALRAITGEM
ncbi:transcriptional regulator [uncultured Mobiluncus sp.]|uniref:transcriptional regulator n=1 Tax=uncultured Mobiluncus sp. TaxID=293425 RepID=UPI0026366A39|nr:transcriptional regulator [uncultured Mobiluncus sp.]